MEGSCLLPPLQGRRPQWGEREHIEPEGDADGVLHGAWLRGQGVYQDEDRPGLKRLLEDVKNWVFNMVVVKDLSRAGRNYLEIGCLMDDFFPRCGIRFVAVNDRRGTK